MQTSSEYSCLGHFYDSGGEYADYIDYEDYYLIIYPIDTNRSVEIEFLYFDIEYEVNCIYDYLKIFDGTSTSDPLIGKFCGTSSPGIVTPTNSEGALCFYFHSDEYVTGPGWEASIICDPPLGIQSIDDFNKILIRSNPTDGIFFVEISDVQQKDVSLMLLNSFGQLINKRIVRSHNETTIQIDISNQPSGIYYLLINTSRGVFSKKIILTK